MIATVNNAQMQGVYVNVPAVDWSLFRELIRKYVSEADLTDLGQYNQARIMKLADFKAMMQYQ